MWALKCLFILSSWVFFFFSFLLLFTSDGITTCFYAAVVLNACCLWRSMVLSHKRSISRPTEWTRAPDSRICHKASKPCPQSSARFYQSCSVNFSFPQRHQHLMTNPPWKGTRVDICGIRYVDWQNFLPSLRVTASSTWSEKALEPHGSLDPWAGKGCHRLKSDSINEVIGKNHQHLMYC